MNASGPSTRAEAGLAELLSSDVPLIAVSFSDRVDGQDIAHARTDGLDVAELRIDRFSSFARDHVLNQVRKFASFPTIATIRLKEEGGEWAGSHQERLRLFEAVLPEVDGIDIELSSSEILPDLILAASELRKVVIVSHHNFTSTPSAGALEDMAHRAKELGADYVKISTMAKSLQDLRVLATFTMDNAALGLIVIAMGGHGAASRIFFPALGSRLTYAFAGNAPVSGQLPFSETFEMLRTFFPAFNEKKILAMQLLDDA